LCDKFVITKENAPTNDEVRRSFEKKYKYLRMDRKSSFISQTLSAEEVICWRGANKAYMYF
jgi:hypothetical protein